MNPVYSEVFCVKRAETELSSWYEASPEQPQVLQCLYLAQVEQTLYESLIASIHFSH